MLKLENVSKYYYSSTSVTCALRKINLELNVGEFVAITGESGSGKTTLLNIISGLDSYEDGEMYYYDKKTSFFDDEDWERYRRDEIAFIFQNYNLIDSFTVLENVIVSYVIEGYSYSEAKEKAKEILKLVGLQNDSHKKATKLSGGQKQRLSIARALAKETNIIVADEPTGNLDVENGRSILELLKKVSKDKLVIVVTHNFSQIEPFITRKIRLHDGDIVLDEEVIEAQKVKDVVSLTQKEENNTLKKVMNFSFLNFKSQPKKVFLVLLLVLLCTFSTFIFFANFKANLDDNKTKKLTTDFFENLSDDRLIVKHSDNFDITEEMYQNAMVDNVKSVEKYDLITDINYYRKNDYDEVESVTENESLGGNVDKNITITYTGRNHTRFMRSGSSLTVEDLRLGTLPQNPYEMVVYSDDDSILNTYEKVLFRNGNTWGQNKSLSYEVKIVGLLKEKTNQAYFSENLCQLMDLNSKQFQIKIQYVNISGRVKFLNFNTVALDSKLDYTENDISVDSGKLRALNEKGTTLKENGFSIYYNGEYNYLNLKVDTLNANINLKEDTLGVSASAFEKIYKYFKENKQFALFIDDYSYTDDVINDLAEKNLQAISCFRVSVAGYDMNKVIFRYTNLLISLVALFVMNAVMVFLGFSILRFKKNDYVIFKMLGLSNSLIKKINFVELSFYGIITNIVLIITYVIVNNFTTSELLINTFKYVRVYDFVLVFIITMISLAILSRRFSNFITRKTKVTVLREE